MPSRIAAWSYGMAMAGSVGRRERRSIASLSPPRPVDLEPGWLEQLAKTDYWSFRSISLPVLLMCCAALVEPAFLRAD